MNTGRPAGQLSARRSRRAVLLAAVTAGLLAILVLAQAGTAPSALGAVRAASPGRGAGKLLGSTAPSPRRSSAFRVMPLASRVRVSVFVGRDQAGLAAAAQAISDPVSPRYERFLSPAQVQAEYGATAARQRDVSGWLTRAGLAVTHHDGFVISASGTAAQAESALRVRLGLSHPRGGTEQIMPSAAMTVPASLAGTISTIRVAPAAVPAGQHEPVRAAPVTMPGRPAVATPELRCSAFYGQEKASRLPRAFGRAMTWAPCGYLPSQLRQAYGATQSGLTGAGVTIAILSIDNDSTALRDANRWAVRRHVRPFAHGQFSARVPPGVRSGVGDGESALDIESAHGMAPAAKLVYVAGNGRITGDRLLDSLNTVVTHRLAEVVSSSWFEGYMPVPASMIDAWEGVLKRAAVEGISVNFATGDYGDTTPLQYPGSDPWVTTVGATSLGVGATGTDLWETGWESDHSALAKGGKKWTPAPPGRFSAGSTGGISGRFAEPSYQRGVVTGNKRKGKAMRAVPDVSAFGDWNLGYQIGLTSVVGPHQRRYINLVDGGTSLSSPLFTGFEADLIQGRHGKALGFANPAFYDAAGTDAFHDITGNPQGPGFTEAVVYGPVGHPTLSAMGQCRSTKALTCGPGYDTVSGIGSPGPAFFRSFSSRPSGRR